MFKLSIKWLLRVSNRDAARHFMLGAAVLTFAGCSEGPLAASWSSSTISASGLSLLDNADEAQAVAILTANCTSCHGSTASGGVSDITDVEHLVSVGLVVPGSASTSLIYTEVASGQMPENGSLSSADLLTLQNWMNGSNSGGGAGSTFSTLESGIFETKCVACHSSSRPGGGIDLSSYSGTRSSISVSNPTESPLYTTALQCTTGSPHESVTLTNQQVSEILSWIQAGASNN